MSILAGDIGGTKTLLQLRQDGTLLLERRYRSADHPAFDGILADFLGLAAARGMDAPDAACIAVAGPVEGDRATVTNLPWRLDARGLAAAFGIPRLRLVNDFQAVGYGIETLGEADLHVLQPGEPRARAPRALIGAGTGLGEGILVWCDGHYEVLASEGGHADFAPTDALQRELLDWLSARRARVGYEDLLSGPGLETLYRFHAQRFPEQASSALLSALEAGEGAAAISRAADGGDGLAGQALDMFVSIYGAQAGNLALTCLAAGGVYVAGGIAPRILDRLAAGGFMRAFRAKGKMAGLVARFPVCVITDTTVGVRGAAEVAKRISS